MKKESKALLINLSFNLIGVVIGGAITFSTVYLRTKNDLKKFTFTSYKAELSIIESKAEPMFKDFSEIINYLDLNNTFEIKKAKELLAKTRTSAFAFAAYAPPDLAEKSIALTESINAAITPTDNEDIVSEILTMKSATKELFQLYYRRILEIESKANQSIN